MTTKNIFVITLILSVFMMACNKKLDLKPSDTIDAEKAYRNITDMNEGVIGAYQALTSTTIRSVSLVSDECMLPNDNATGQFVGTYRWQYDPSSTTITNAWGELYIVIDRLNRVLAAADIIKLKKEDTLLRDQYKGELLALRAYCHLELLRNFADKYEATAKGVPFMTESKISSPSRDNFGQVISKINADLTAARELFPASFEEKTRITLNTVIAIQARTALYAKDWTNAATYAKEVIDAEPLAGRTDFPRIWTPEKNNAEVLWRLARTSSDEDFAGDTYYDTRGFILYVPSFALLNTFDKDNDIRFSAYIRTSPDAGGTNAPYIVSKYEGNTEETQNLADMIPFRTGEMYLILAEALAEGDDTEGGANALNELRTARITGYTAETFAGKDTLIRAIYSERFKELAFEGHRFFDLRRRNLPVSRLPEDAVNALGATLLQSTDTRYTFPIPDAEIMANKNMLQNSNY
ncbi:Starch-binding associating with outer membrane [Chitinophaga sp. CF118]|uniref:RagB/SusD family nutrient uptake outer membrane protein n=1 Tax=Chitinophaga sp. CF118 TaxID=1884367 RepID=UPI0008F25DFB|nr:RagB/SusD family nutrient uptake outer membrane protein [Chitinophaga sp. CF118]SFE80187.1 Starch-binding associating with outer membrane [Chitinophaga sp. CF118]